MAAGKREREKFGSESTRVHRRKVAEQDRDAWSSPMPRSADSFAQFFERILIECSLDTGNSPPSCPEVGEPEGPEGKIPSPREAARETPLAESFTSKVFGEASVALREDQRPPAITKGSAELKQESRAKSAPHQTHRKTAYCQR